MAKFFNQLNVYSSWIRADHLPVPLSRAIKIMYSQRFDLYVHVTRHARERMAERSITESELLVLIELGIEKYKDDTRFWIARYFLNRQDNLLSIAGVLEDRLVVKTVMHHFQWENE